MWPLSFTYKGPGSEWLLCGGDSFQDKQNKMGDQITSFNFRDIILRFFFFFEGLTVSDNIKNVKNYLEES